MRVLITAFFIAAIFLSTQAKADNRQFFCSDYHFKKVKWKWAESPSAVSESPVKVANVGYQVDGTPILKVDKKILSHWGVDPLLGQYALNYACARLTLGHVIKPTGNFHETLQKVNSADCWAINRFYYDSRHPEEIVDEIQEKINSLPREKWVHFPGPIRIVDFKGSCHLKGRDDFR